MKSRIVRAKNFVRNHNHGLATAGGLVVGAAVTYRVLTTQGEALHLRLTVEQAKKLLADPNVCVSYDTPRQLLHVFVDPNS
jgi:shikimate kinase